MSEQKPKIYALVGASEFNDQHFLANYNNNAFYKVIAIDAGFEHLKKINVVPDIAIGDFDSLGYVPEGDFRVMQYPVDKDKTDLELAIEEAISDKPQCIMIYGILGKRLDHEISAIQMLSRVADFRIGVFAIGLEQSAVVINGPSEFGLKAVGNDKTLSIFALTDVVGGLDSKGLKWPYVNTTLSSVMSLGISNEIIENDMKIKVQHGKILIVFATDHLKE
ncbi:MAG: thiamine diphosphokinase [Coriobacteriia bacterium]|nr:thiamine diphosphokinase [Coriobacteriia bacterium]